MPQRESTAQQPKCIDRIRNNKATASKKQSYKTDRFIPYECTACGHFYPKDAFERHWKNKKREKNSVDSQIITICLSAIGFMRLISRMAVE